MTECEPKATITVDHVEELAKKIKAKRAEKDGAAEALSQINTELDSLEQESVRVLNALGKKSFAAEAGLLTKVVKWQVKQPETEEDKQKFFAYLKEKGIYEQTISVNSQKLLSLYLQEWEAVKESGDPIDALNFRIPGIKEATSYETLSFRKK